MLTLTLLMSNDDEGMFHRLLQCCLPVFTWLLEGGRPSEGLLGTKADDDNFDDCASIYFKLSWTSYCANKLQNMFANRTENRVILCWVFFQRWYKTSLTSRAPARLGQGGQGQHRLDWRARQNVLECSCSCKNLYVEKFCWSIFSPNPF